MNSATSQLIVRYAVGLACLLFLANCAAPRRTADAGLGLPPAMADYDYRLPSALPDEHELASARAEAAANPGDPAALRRVGAIYQTLSPPENWEYLEKAIDLLEKSLELAPEHPGAMIHLGLAKAAKAKSPKVPLLEKLFLAKRGFDYMDRSVAAIEDNFSFRLLRAKAGLLAPPILGRRQSVAEDRDYLAARLEAAEGMPPYLQAAGYIFLGDYEEMAKENPEQARMYWHRARELGEGTLYGERAADRLEGRKTGFL